MTFTQPTNEDQKAQLACTLASVILYDEKISITSEKIASVLASANVTVAPYWPGLFNKTFSSANIGELIFTAPTTGPAPAGGAVAANSGSSSAAPAEEKKEEEKKEKKAESEADIGADGLFGDAGNDY